MKKHFVFIVSLGLVLVLNIYFRIFTINFPQLKSRAKAIVEQNILREASEKVDQKFPDFSNSAKGRLAATLFSDYQKHKKAELKKEIKDEYLKLKDRYQDESGQTYLLELDCWNWARYVDNVLRLGHPGDKVISGRQFDSLMLAPLGKYLPWSNFLFYLSAFLYKLFSLIKPLPLFSFLFYLPLFFSLIFIAVLYLFSFRLGGHIGAMVSCLFVGLCPVFLHHSCAGWFDMDVLNLLLPVLVVWTYLTASCGCLFKKRILLIFLSSFWLGLFSFTWIGWWFILPVIIMYEIYSLINLISAHLQYKEKNSVLFKQHIFNLSLFIFFSIFWILLFSGPRPLVALYRQIREALFLNAYLTRSSVWPNVFSVVAELQKRSLFEIIKETSGIPIFILSVISILVLFLHTRKNPKSGGFRRETIVIFIFWFFSMLFASFKGIKFFMFLIVPMGISLGWFINEAREYFKNRNKKWGIYLVIVVTVILGDNFMSRAYKEATNIFPLMNDTWYKTLTVFKESTPPEAVINSWWDFGDWFKAVSRRRVIFDGQSQNTAQAYWMAKVLMSADEEEAIGILRMLNNAGNRAFEIISAELKNPLESILLLEQAVSSQPAMAKETLMRYLPISAAEEVLKLLFAKPDKAYFIVDYTMLEKMEPISYLGTWDFLRAYLAQGINKKTKKQLIDYLVRAGIDAQKAEKLYQEATLVPGQDLYKWVSHKRRFYNWLAKGREVNDMVLFDNGFAYRPNEQNIYLYSLRDMDYKIPKSLFVFKQDKLQEQEYPDSTMDFSALVFKAGGDYQAVLLDRELAKSLFVRLYLLAGRGLKHFKPFMEEKDGENYIRVFEIIWD